MKSILNIVPAGAVIRFGLPLSHIHMRKGYVGDLPFYQVNSNLKEIIRTTRERMKSVDPSLTTQSEGMLSLKIDI
jgi:hypothetical protein